MAQVPCQCCGQPGGYCHRCGAWHQPAVDGGCERCHTRPLLVGSQPVLPRSAFRFPLGARVRIQASGLEGDVICISMAVGEARPYCVATDPEHADQVWLAEAALEAAS